ncbi:MAG: arginine repressor [Bacteroidaceae bacterium]|nr:arginine repressor [Bacteroidaceae bacterium]
MAAKKTRLEMVRTLLKENPYESQEELLAALREAGFAVAQPTLSRDLRTLKVSKVFTDAGTYAYVLPAAPLAHEPKQHSHHTYGFRSVDFSGNLAVIKTASGYAGSLSAELDRLDSADVVGTVAGDDTIIVVMREGTQRSVIHNMLKAVLPHYGE